MSRTATPRSPSRGSKCWACVERFLALRVTRCSGWDVLQEFAVGIGPSPPVPSALGGWPGALYLAELVGRSGFGPVVQDAVGQGHGPGDGLVHVVIAVLPEPAAHQGPLQGVCPLPIVLVAAGVDVVGERVLV